MPTTLTRKHLVCCAISLFVLALLVSCSPQKPTEDSEKRETGNGSSEPAITVAWSADGDCSTCHTDQNESSKDAKCLASQHADISCIECHTDISALSTAHSNATADGKMSKTLKATVIDETAVCESCHNLEEITALSASSTVLTDENGTVVNPHALSASEKHAEVTCTSCHKMHSSTDSAKSAQRACTSCHHTNVYECNTCHAA